jgi:hypothetical protein
MAKAKNLAILAGLAGLAYANRDKLGFGSKDKDKSKSSGMTTEQNDELATVNRISKMSDDSDTLARVNREESSGVPKTKSDVLKAITAPKTAPNDQAGNQGVIPPKSSGKSAAAKQAPSDRRTSESSMSRGTRPAVAKDPNYSNEGRSSTAPAAKNPNYSNEGRNSVAPTSTPVATTTKISDVPKSTANKFEHEMPISRFFKNVREAGNRGNPDANNMASGGMTASRRGDGIASRGKTRGKIC